MVRRTFDVARLCAVVCLCAAASLGGCFTEIRTSFPDAGGGGSVGIGGAGCRDLGDTSDAGSDTKACVDLMSDGKNCGSCGHDCLGGACEGGQCQPVLIAQYFGHPEIIYVGAAVVYVTTDVGYVGRANKDGSDLKPIAMPAFAASAFLGTVVAEDGDRVFLVRVVGGNIQLSYCSTSGCDATATSIGGQYTQFFAVDPTDHRIVWVDYTPARLVSAPTQGTVSGVDLPGGMLAAGSNGSRLFYAQGGVYFADGYGVSRIPVAGGSIATVTGGTTPLAILGANSTSLFVYDGNSIGSTPLPSGDGRGPKPVITSAVDLNVHGHFAADSSSIFGASDGQASTCQISNCAGTQKALPKRNADRISDVAVDATAVYLVEDSFDDNSAVTLVWRLAK